MKDLLLNMTEEIWEIWNLIKRLNPEEQKIILEKEKIEVEDFVWDMMYLLLKIAYLAWVDANKSIHDVMIEHEQRFPVDKIKWKHTNIKMWWIDLKY